MSKKHYIYRVRYNIGGYEYGCFLRTLTACVAFAKSLCEKPYEGFRFLRYKFDSVDILDFDSDCTDAVLRILDKLFPLNSSKDGQK